MVLDAVFGRSLQNSGATALTINSVSITGSDPHDFLLTNHCGSSLAAGGSCTMDIVFKPAAKGTRTASLVVTDNAKTSSLTSHLSGVGD
jgi:hypothetical protein